MISEHNSFVDVSSVYFCLSFSTILGPTVSASGHISPRRFQPQQGFCRTYVAAGITGWGDEAPAQKLRLILFEVA